MFNHIQCGVEYLYIFAVILMYKISCSVNSLFRTFTGVYRGVSVAKDLLDKENLSTDAIL